MSKNYCPNCGMSLSGGDMGGAAGEGKLHGTTPGGAKRLDSAPGPEPLKSGKGASRGASIVIALLKKHKSKGK